MSWALPTRTHAIPGSVFEHYLGETGKDYGYAEADGHTGQEWELWGSGKNE